MTTVSLAQTLGVAYQSFTNGGLPNNAGLIYTYSAGSTTPQATYTTSAGTVQNANPIVLDASGRPPSEVWLIVGDAYRFDIADKNDNIIKSYDNISAPYGSDSLSGSTGASLVGFLPAGSGAVARTVQDKLRESRSIIDYDGTPSSSAAVNAAALLDAASYLSSTFGGGIIRVPANLSYDISGSVVVLPANVVIEGDCASSAYDTVNYSGGSVFSCTDGDFAIRLSGRQSGVRGIRLTGQGGTTAYGIVASGSGGIQSVLDNVSAAYFEYNFALANVNRMRVHNCNALLATKIGLVVLPSNNAGVGAYAYPLIASYVTGTASTTFAELDVVAESNLIGVALLSGERARLTGVIESNQYYGLLIFKRDNTCDGFTFGPNFWMEANATVASPTVWDISSVEALRTGAGAGQFLESDVFGIWTSAAEAYAGIWLGAESENINANPQLGPMQGPYFLPGCELSSNGNLVRGRSYNGALWDHTSLGSGSPTTFNNKTKAYKGKIRDPQGALQTQVSQMQVGGTYTTYEISDTQCKGTLANTTTGTWNNIIDIATLSPNNNYRFSIAPSAQYALYGAQGVAFYDGTNVELLTGGFTGAGGAIQISGTTLQYKQSSGGDIANVFWKIFCDGPMDYVPV